MYGKWEERGEIISYEESGGDGGGSQRGRGRLMALGAATS